MAFFLLDPLQLPEVDPNTTGQLAIVGKSMIMRSHERWARSGPIWALLLTPSESA
jgi:hypothetical protein